MADERLRIRIDYESATLNQLSAELKRIKGEMKDVAPTSADFATGTASIQTLTSRMKELNDTMVKTKSEFGNLSGAEIQQSVEVQRLIAVLRNEHSTIGETNTAIRQLTTIIKENATAAEVQAGAWATSTEAVVVAKNRNAQAAQIMYSENAKMKDSYFTLGEQLRAFSQVAIAAFAAYQSVKFVSNAAEEGSRIELLRENLEKLGQTKNFNATELMNQLRSATHNATGDMELLQVATKAVALGNVPMEKLPAIMEKLHDISLRTHEPLVELANDFFKVGELGKERLQVTFGLMFDAKKSEEDYAASIGRTKDQLTDSEKEYAHLAAATDELLKRQALEKTAARDNAENFEKVQAAGEKLKVAIADLVASPLGKFLASAALEAAIAAEGVLAFAKTMIAAGQAARGDLAGAAETVRQIGDIGSTIKTMGKEISDLWTEQTDSVTQLVNTENVAFSKRKQYYVEWEAQVNTIVKDEKERARIIAEIHREEELVEKQHQQTIAQLRGQGKIGPAGAGPPAHTETDKERKAAAKETSTFLKDTEKMLADERKQIQGNSLEELLATENRFHTDRTQEMRDAVERLGAMERNATGDEKRKYADLLAKLRAMELPEETRHQEALINIRKKYAADTLANEIQLRKQLAEVEGNAVLASMAQEEANYQAALVVYEKARLMFPERAREINAEVEKAQKEHAARMRAFQAESILGAPKEVAMPPKPPVLSEEDQHDIEVAQKMMEQWQPLTETLSWGFDAVRSSSAKFFQDFADRAVGSTSIFQQFVGGVIQGIGSIMTRLASSAAMAGIFSLITKTPFMGAFSALTGLKFAGGGDIMEPVVGVGVHSGKRYEIGEAGFERVMPYDEYNRLRNAGFAGSKAGTNLVQLHGDFNVQTEDRAIYGRIKFQRQLDLKRGGNW